MIILSKEKRKKSELDREEFGYGFDLSPDDLDVRGNNDQTQEQLNNASDQHQYNKKNSSTQKK